MNKKILFVMILASSVKLAGQETTILEKPAVDKRVEILSIAFRLAGSPEYSSTTFKLYTDRIEEHFGQYRNHELIEFAKKIREEKGVSYDAVMKMAVHIGNPPDFNPLVKFTNIIPEKRWGKKNALEFISLLRKFYIDTDCETFFLHNSVMYREASTRFLNVYNYLDIGWYREFYGKDPDEKFKIINGLGNGGGNYGPDIMLDNGEREVYAIMGAWSTDSLGWPVFETKNYFPTLLHEFNHSFINYLTAKYRNELKEYGRKIYKAVEHEMNVQAYGNWETMINEALVRAAVIKYMKDHDFAEKNIDHETSLQLNRGFLWISELLAELENYSNHRDKYPDLESYMPEIIEFYNMVAGNLHQYEKGKSYQLVLTGKAFKSADRISMKDYEINFKTRN